MESNNDFSRSLALLRREKGVSQREAARELGVSHHTFLRRVKEEAAAEQEAESGRAAS